MNTIDVKSEGGLVTVTLNRPAKKNAINDQMWLELAEVFTEVERRPEDRVLIITGEGGDFCSGVDLTDTSPSTDTWPSDTHPLFRMRRIGDVASLLHQLSVPTIARVDGVAVGAGCNLALGCDFVLASDRSRFCEIFPRRGLSVDFGGSWLLPRLVGLRRAKELCLLAPMLSAKEALAAGLINRVAPLGQLDQLVADWAAQLNSGPPIALAQTKRLLDNAAAVSMEQALEDEARAQVVNLATVDSAEALAAFVEKRSPAFTGNFVVPSFALPRTDVVDRMGG